MAAPDMEVIKDIPGYKVILKAVLKSQIQQLVEQLAETTDEESVILTASVSDGTLSHLGSNSGKNFLDDHEDIKSQFLGFCLKRHHMLKQEKERQEAEKLAERNRMPTTPTRYGGPRPGFMQRSPRFSSPRQGPHPVALTRAGGPVPMRGGPGMRHSPYPMQRPMRRPNLEQQGPGRGPGPGPVRPHLGTNQVIKIEPDDNGDESNMSGGDNAANTSQPASPSVTQQSTPSNVKPESSDKDDDAHSESSSSTIPNEASDMKFSDTAPPEGLSLDSDLSNLISETEAARASKANNPESDSTQPGQSGSSELDPNVRVKMEAAGDGELEITGVELGSVSGSMGGAQPWNQMGGAMGSQADMEGAEQGYSIVRHDSDGPDESYGSDIDIDDAEADGGMDSADEETHTPKGSKSTTDQSPDVQKRQNTEITVTERQTKWAVKMLKDWMLEINFTNTSFEWLSRPDLDSLLERFYTTVQTKEGQRYSKSALVGVRAGINRYLTSPPISRDISIMKNREFNASNQALSEMIETMKREGHDMSTHKEPIDEPDIQRLYESGVFNEHSPKTLQNKVLFDVISRFGVRGRHGLRALQKSSFTMAVDGQGRRYVKMVLSEADSADSKKKRREPRMYENSGKYCPIRSFELYLSKLNPISPDLFQKPLAKPSRDIWYTARPVGINTLATFMSRMSDEAGLSRKYTNHCIRAYVTTTLHQIGF